MLNKKPFLVLFLIYLIIYVGRSNTYVIASEKPDYFFSVHMVAPTTSAGMMPIKLIEQELPKIGIDVELDWINWAAMRSRCIDQEVGMYSEGGYDVSIFGLSLGTPEQHPGAILQRTFGAEAIPPNGFNVMYWSPEIGKNYNTYRAQESEDLIQNFTTNLNLTQARLDLNDWQKIWYDVMPNVLIYNRYEVHAVSAGLYGYDPVNLPLNSIENIWLTGEYIGTADQVVLAACTGGDVFNPMIGTDVYDQYGNNPVFDGIVGNTPSIRAVLPSGTNRDTWMMENYNTTAFMTLYPRVAEAMGTWSSDGLLYVFDVRENVYFHDGHIVDGWDVALSFQAHIIPAIGSLSYSNLIVPFGQDDKANNHGNYSFAVSDPGGDGFYEHVNITLNTTFASFETDYVGTWIFPEHILGDPVNHGFDSNGDFDPDSTWIVRPGDWRSHSTTTGRITDPGGYNGPIGCGSMIFKEFESSTGIIILQKFEDIKWDNSTSQWVVTPGISHWNIANLGDMPDTATIILKSMDSAVADMKSGKVNLLDPQFTLVNIFNELQTEPTIQPILTPERGLRTIYFNPKFVKDGVYHLQKKGVRHAISHVVPREKIITDYMDGLAFPAYTPLHDTSWAAISETELIEYKKTLLATDGATPESDAVTAYDEYSIEKAFDWLDTEGYDTFEWRKYTQVSTTTSSRGVIPGFEFLGVVALIVFLSIYSNLQRNKL